MELDNDWGANGIMIVAIFDNDPGMGPARFDSGLEWVWGARPLDTAQRTQPNER
jgi:hypothetical protein